MNKSNLPSEEEKEHFSALVEGVKYKLYKTGMSILKNDDDVYDAIQETLISAYQNYKNIRNIEYFNTWIIRILINKCYDLIRNNKKITNINQKVMQVTDSYYEMYCNDSEVEQILNQLDPDLKTVSVLYYYDDLPVAEIANILNIPEGTVKSRLARARKKISALYQFEEGGDENG